VCTFVLAHLDHDSESHHTTGKAIAEASINSFRLCYGHEHLHSFCVALSASR